MSKGELWNILPYTGIWGANGVCGKTEAPQMPPIDTTYLTGIPFTGDNTGANPNLRLMTFVADTPQGPISTTGPRSTFFRTGLEYKISWKIENLGVCGKEKVQIGFYTDSYTSQSPGPNNMLLMLAREGPALYKRSKGSFVTSDLVDMFVVVDADVVVKLKVTASLPEPEVVPCFTELYRSYQYRSENGVLMATQMLIDQNTGDTLLKPAKRYIETAREMIAFLFRTSVDVIIFQTPNTLDRRLLTQSEGRLIQLFPYTGSGSQIPLTRIERLLIYDLRPLGFPVTEAAKPDGILGFTLFSRWNEIAYKVRYRFTINTPIVEN